MLSPGRGCSLRMETLAIILLISRQTLNIAAGTARNGAGASPKVLPGVRVGQDAADPT